MIKGNSIICRKIEFDLKQETINLLFLISVLWIIGMTIFPIEIGIHYNYGPTINLVPLSSIKGLMSHFYYMVPLRNFAGNIILFVPLGIMLTLKFNKLNSVLRVGVTGFLCSTCIEFVQFFLPMRATDVDDIILNTLGTMIGFLVIKTSVRIVHMFAKSES